MNMTRAIIEGIHEVELEISPEFRKEWETPQFLHRTEVSEGPKGHERYHGMMVWPNGSWVVALEIKNQPGPKHWELNVWSPKANIKPGDWTQAMLSIAALGKYGRIYV